MSTLSRFFSRLEAAGGGSGEGGGTAGAGGGGAAAASLLGGAGAGGSAAAAVVPADWDSKLFGADGRLDKTALETLPPDFADLKGQLGKYTTRQEFLRGTLHLAKLAGAKAGLQPLAADATPEQRAAHSTELAKLIGVPEKAEGYGITKPEQMPEGMQWDQKAVDGFLAVAKEHNVSPSAAKAIVAYQQQLVAAQLAGQGEAAKANEAQQVAQIKAELPAGVQFKEYTASVDRGVAVASRLSGLPPEKVQAMAKSAGLADMAKLLSALDQAAGEDHSTRGRAAPSDDIDARITAIERDPLMSNPQGDPKARQKLLDERRQLLAQKHGFMV